MIHILLVSQDNIVFKELEAALAINQITFDWTDTAQNALSMLSKKNFDLFITHEQLPDTTGRDLIEKVLFQNAMMNCVVLSALPPKDFHEAYEGLGVLMQFPLNPGEKHVLKLLEHLNLIARIASRTNKPIGEQI